MLETSKFKLKQVKSVVRDAEARFKILFNQAPIPLYIFRIDGTLADSNPAAEKLTGFSELITKEMAVKIGIRDFLMKPLTARSLGQTVRKVLNAK
jgi:PAS domain S-box-containing protein